MSKDNRRQDNQRLGEQQVQINESILELYLLNTFLHQVAQTYSVRFSLQRNKEGFTRRAVMLFWTIGKFKRLAKTVRVKLASNKV